MLRFSPSRGAGALVLNSLVRGPTGAAATITAGTGTSLAEGATPTVTNSGTSSAAVFDFGIPRGVIPAVGFNFDTTTTDADPGAGDVRFNHATPASVTAIYFDNVDRDGVTITAWLDSFDDSTNTHKGVLTFTPAATPTAKLIYDVSGTVVDGTGYRKVTVSHVSGTTLPSNAAHLAVVFSRTGNVGVIGGSTGASDNRLLRSDGTGGATLQSTGITADDSDNLTGVASITVGNAGLHVLDTNASHDLVIVPGSDLSADHNLTLTTGDADRTVTISGDATISQDYSTTGNPQFATVTLNNNGLHLLDTNASHDLILAPGSDLSADHTLTVTTGDSDRTLTISGNATVSQDYSSSGSPEFTAVNVGHASDTTISRSAAGVIEVEGVPLYSNVPQNSQSTAYTTVLADAQKHILHPSTDNNARTFTIDSNANVAYPIGTAITFVNQINVVTIAITSDTLTLAGTGATGSRTLAAAGIATALKVGTTSWLISGSGLT